MMQHGVGRVYKSVRILTNNFYEPAPTVDLVLIGGVGAGSPKFLHLLGYV